jgi:hypothetical protein
MTQETHEFFDNTFHSSLKKLSNNAVATFINGLFDKIYPPESHIVFDTIIGAPPPPSCSILVAADDAYLITTAADKDDGNTVMTLVCGFNYALEHHKDSDNPDRPAIIFPMPHTRLIYWNASGETPEKCIVKADIKDSSRVGFKLL